MKRIWTRLWKDQRGAVSVLSTLLLYTILVLGMTVGLVTLRNQFVQEFGDLAVALDHLDQSWTVKYSWESGPHGPTPDTSTLTDPDGSEPAGISVQRAATSEGAPLVIPPCP